MPAILKKVLKILLWIVVSTLLLFALIVVLIRMPSVQNFIVNKIEPVLEEKTGTVFDIGRVYLSFPKNVTLEGLYVEDLKGDTLVNIGYLDINIGLFGLLKNQVDIGNVLLENSTVNLFKDSANGEFNFDFIIKSFQGDTTKKEEPKSAWEIKAGGLELKNFRFTYIDQIAGMDVKATITDLELDIDDFDLDTMEFIVDEFNLSGGDFEIKLLGSPTQKNPANNPADDDEKTRLNLTINDLQISESRFLYSDSSQQALAKIENLLFSSNSFSLHDQQISSALVELDESFVHYQILKQDSTVRESDEKTNENAAPWKINVEQVRMEENEVKFDNWPSSTPDTVVQGMDFNHLHFNGLHSNLRNISIEGADIGAEIGSFLFTEQSGFALKKFSTQFQMKGEKITAENLNLQTEHSSIAANIIFFMSSFTEKNATANPSKIQIASAQIHPADIMYFVDVSDNIPVNQPLVMESNITGWLHNLSIQDLTASIGGISLAIEGQLTGLPEMNEFYFDVPNVTLKGNAQTLKSILPDTLLPQTLQLPEELNISANVRGHLNDMQGQFSGETSLGNIYFKGSFKNDTLNNYVDLNGNLEVDRFDVGKLLKNEQMGILAASFSFDGAGKNITTTNIGINGGISLFQYNDYDYEDIKIDGNILGKSYKGRLSSEDENLRFYFNGLADLQDSIPQFDLRLDLVHVNLQALNMTPEQFIVSGVITAEIDSDDEGRINGNAGIRRAKIIRQGEFFAIDSMIMVSVSEKATTDIKFTSGILNAGLSGNVDVLKIGSILKHHVDQYFSENMSTDSLEAELQEFKFSVELVDPTILTDVFLPELEVLNIETIEGSFNNRQNSLNLNINIPQIIYGALELDTLFFSISSNDRKLTGDLTFELLKNDLLHINDFSLQASSAEKALNLLVNIPLKNKKDFQLGMELYREESAYFLSLLPGALVFNGNNWTAPEDNYLKIGDGIWFDNFTMQNGNKQLSVNSGTTEANDTTLSVNFQNFELKALTEPFGENDTVNLASGIANGSIRLLNLPEGLSLNSNLQIKDLSVMNNSLGDFTLTNEYRNGQNVYDLSINGKGAELEANGIFISRDTTTHIETKANIARMELSAIYPFVKEHIEKLNGELSGNISFKTTEEFPEIDGRIKFSNVNLTPVLTGVELNIDDQQIRINNQNVVLNNFKINAVDNGSVVLNGNLDAGNFPEYQLSMGLTADNFMVLNTTEKDNELYYGQLRISGNANVNGDQNLLNVKANVQVVNGSKMVYVVPRQQASVITAEGLVRYINTRKDTASAIGNTMDSDVQAAVQGIDLTANISINKESAMSVIIDQQTGDRLDVSGDANLTLTMPPNANMSLSGRYEISEGSYKLNFYEFVKREFEIVKGSYILWTGDPLDARLDVTTRYVVTTLPPIGEINRRLPFHVNLKVTEEILNPELSFALALPDDLRQEYSNVSTFLQNINSQETELNKQVFSLIVFNSFMISGGAGSGDLVSSTARQSLSKILSQQLNKLAGNLDFVDLDLNLQSYETGSAESAQGRTDLELGLSKSLFNNRVTVRVESHVNLEGEDQSRQGMSNYTGDIIIEYKLTKDGVYRLQVFNKNEYDVLFGNLNKTGAGVIMIRDYNKSKELFRREEVE